jgi:hypothetical protein
MAEDKVLCQRNKHTKAKIHKEVGEQRFLSGDHKSSWRNHENEEVRFSLPHSLAKCAGRIAKTGKYSK